MNHLRTNLIKLLMCIGLNLIIVGCSFSQVTELNGSENIIDLSSLENMIDLSGDSKFSSIELTDIVVRKFDLPELKQGEIFDYCVYGSKIYYVVSYDIFAEYVNHIDVFCYDYVEKSNRKVYEYKDDSKRKFLLELRVNSKYMVWLEIAEGDVSWELYKMNLETGKIEIIRSYEDSGSRESPSIILTESYLSWLETFKNKDDSYNSNLMLYTFDNNSVNLIEKNVYTASPYIRARIHNNKLTYCTKQKESNKIIVNIYDIITGKKQQILTGKDEIVCFESNGEKTIWKDGYIDYGVFVYDHNKDKLYLLESSDPNRVVYYVGMYKNYITIEYTTDKDGKNNLYFYDLENMNRVRLTDNKYNLYQYVCLHNTPDDKFTAEIYGREEKVSVLIIEDNE